MIYAVGVTGRLKPASRGRFKRSRWQNHQLADVENRILNQIVADVFAEPLFGVEEVNILGGAGMAVICGQRGGVGVRLITGDLVRRIFRWTRICQESSFAARRIWNCPVRGFQLTLLFKQLTCLPQHY